MNHEVQDLIEKANKIISVAGNKPGTRYPISFKKIVISLRLDHKLSVNDVVKCVGVSTYSAREWPKSIISKNRFNKLTVIKNQNEKILQKEKTSSYYSGFKLIIFQQKILIALITLLIFESLIFHLI